MKILHTADWHLGKKLDDYSRHEEQQLVLAEIEQIADREQVDLIIIAGDLYDSINPPLEAQTLFYQTIKRLAKDGARPVIAIAGNHDSPDRIDSPDPLAKECGIIFIGKPKANIGVFELANKMRISKSDAGFIEICLPQHPPLRLIHTAFANEQRLKAYFGAEKATGLNQLLQEHWQTLADTYCDTEGINLLTTHLFMQATNGEILEEPEGEKPLKIGNADLVQTHIIPQQIQYTALGHLHRYHNIGTPEKPIVYSSAPLAYSFSEAGQDKYVIIIDASPNTTVQKTKIKLTQGRQVCRKTFDQIEDAVIWLQNNPNSLVELTIKTDSFLTPQELKLLHENHDGIVYIIPVVTKKGYLHQTQNHEELDLTKDVQSLFIDYFKHRNKGIAPSQDLLDIFNQIISES